MYNFLQPFYFCAAQSTTFYSGSEAIQEIEIYVKNGFLQSTTHFVTIEMKDCEMNFNHEQLIVIFERFLHDYVCHQPTAVGLSLKTILSLIQLILQMQYFIYDNKLYQQTKGAGSDLSITKLLVDIYLFYVQQDLIEVLREKREVYGR